VLPPGIMWRFLSSIDCQPGCPYIKAMTADALKTDRFEMRVPAALLRAVDEWRRRQSDLPNRSEAIRRLIELGLKAAEKQPA
jgi:hypothetical protein